MTGSNILAERFGKFLDNQYPQRWIGRGGPHRASLACQVSRSETLFVMKNTVIYIGRKNGSQYHIRQFSLGRIYH
jgi:hypothetical protein